MKRTAEEREEAGRAGVEGKEDAHFVATMKDVVAVYRRYFDEDEVLVCVDETAKQFVKETRTLPSLPAGASSPSEAESRGRAQRRRMRLSGKSSSVVLMMDNLNTHALGSLYAAFEPAAARR